MSNPLNYSASAPVDIKAPFSVTVPMDKDGKAKLPGTRFQDYKPHPNASSVVVPTDRTDVKRNYMRPPVARYEQDYISPSDSKLKREGEKLRISAMAKEMWEGEKQKRIAYRAAQDLISKSSETDDSDEVKRARRMIEKSKPPMTKEECMEKAAKNFYGLKA